MHIFTRSIRLGLVLVVFSNSASALTTGYTLREIVPEESEDSSYRIYSGNQSLNDRGQVIGERRQYASKKTYNYGWRGFIWEGGGTRIIATFGADSNKYGSSQLSALSVDGQITGTSILFENGVDKGRRAFLWSDGRLEKLSLGSEFIATYANAINAAGLAAGHAILYKSGIDKGSRAIAWIGAVGQNLGTLGLSKSGYGNSTALGVNTWGQVIGNSEYYDPQGELKGYHAFLWSKGKMNDLGTFGRDLDGFSSSSVTALNDVGQLVGSSEYYDKDGKYLGTHAFLWVQGKLRDLGALGSSSDGFSYSAAYAINAIGQVIGVSDYYNDSGEWEGNHAFIWTQGRIQDLGVLGPAEPTGTGYSFPYAINQLGEVVGYSSTRFDQNGNGELRAFLYRKKRLLDLNALLPKGSDWVLENALAINNKSQILAYGTKTHANRSSKGFVLLTKAAHETE